MWGGIVLRKFFLSFFLYQYTLVRLLAKVRDGKYSRAAGGALLIDGGYFPWQQGLIETRLGVRSLKCITLIFLGMWSTVSSQTRWSLRTPFSFNILCVLKMKVIGNSLAVQWLGLNAFTATARVQSLVGELRSRNPRGTAEKRERKKVINACLKKNEKGQRKTSASLYAVHSWGNTCDCLCPFHCFLCILNIYRYVKYIYYIMI